MRSRVWFTVEAIVFSIGSGFRVMIMVMVRVIVMVRVGLDSLGLHPLGEGAGVDEGVGVVAVGEGAGVYGYWDCGCDGAG